MRIAVYSSVFPALSETFIINQIVGLIKQGVDVDIIADERVDSEVMHDSVKKYNLLDKVKCDCIPASTAKLNKLFLALSSSLLLLLKGNVSSIVNIILDRHLSKIQKINLLYMLSQQKGKATHYSNIICHFGNKGYYVCKLRELGLISGPVSTVFHAQEICHYKLIEQNMPAYKCLFESGDLMLPISELWRNRLIEWGCEPSKVKVHRMGIDLNDFKRQNRGPELSCPLRVIQVGRLTEKKAILDSINAVVRASKNIDIDFSIIGDGELLEEAEQLIESLESSQFIHLLGRQPQEVVKEKLNASDVFLLPSVTADNGDMEGVPVALMEAMANGLIALSTYHSGIPELIEDPVSGFLVEEKQVEQLADKLITISSLSVNEVEAIRENARAKCAQEFNNDILNKALTEYFQ